MATHDTTTGKTVDMIAAALDISGLEYTPGRTERISQGLMRLRRSEDGDLYVTPGITENLTQGIMQLRRSENGDLYVISTEAGIDLASKMYDEETSENMRQQREDVLKETEDVQQLERGTPPVEVLGAITEDDADSIMDIAEETGCSMYEAAGSLEYLYWLGLVEFS